jgi:acetyltransferase
VSRDRFQALFEPRGVLVAGVSTHPGKFGFVSLHNILASGYQGAVYGSSREAGEVLGVPVVADLGDLPEDGIDLVFVCTPASANVELLRACAGRGIRAAFLASAGPLPIIRKQIVAMNRASLTMSTKVLISQAIPF